MNTKKVYALFQTDRWMMKNSRVFCGIFTSEAKARSAAKMNGLKTDDSEVLVLECDLNKFEEQ